MQLIHMALVWNIKFRLLRAFGRPPAKWGREHGDKGHQKRPRYSMPPSSCSYWSEQPLGTSGPGSERGVWSRGMYLAGGGPGWEITVPP